MNEHSLIKKYFVPLAESFPGSFVLSDDAAILSLPEGHDLIVTKDAISEGVHFIGDEDPSLIAQKLLRTNLSDLAAMGATPYCYFLSIALPKPLSADYIEAFAKGLAEDQKLFGIHLAGGDTIATTGSPTFSLTAHGLVPRGQALRRNGAKPGDSIYVSGTLGDAALGLASLRAKRGNPSSSLYDEALVQRYLLPQPRLALGQQLRGLATSCMDISDGLLQDMGQLCAASGVGADIDREALPLSSAASAWITQDASLWPLIYAGGDDYELLFTLPENAKAPGGTTQIGRIIQGSGVKLWHQGQEVPVIQTGYSH